MSDIKNLYEKRAALQASFNELDGKEQKSAEDQAKFDEIWKDFEAISVDITREERAVQMRAEIAMKQEERKAPVVEDEMQEFRKKLQEKRAFEVVEKRAAIQTVTTTGGGNTIPTILNDAIEVAMKYYMPFTAENGFTVVKTDGGYDFVIPGVNDTANIGYQININTSAETSATAFTFNHINTFKAFKFTSGMIQIPTELIEDSIINITQFIADQLAVRMGRAKAKAFTDGAGTTSPMGCSTKIKATAAMQVVPASNTALARTDIVNLKYAIDPIYANKPQSKFMLHNQMLKRIALLSVGSADDRPLWQPSMAVGEPATIEGMPYIVNNFMDDTLAKTKLSIIFGDMSKYWVRQVNDRRVNVTTERYAEFDQLGIVMWERFDGQIVDAGTNPIKGLYHNRT